MRQRDGSPVWLADGAPARVLDRADLHVNAASGGFDEAWLQNLLYENPKVFPVEQIEPGLGDLVALCQELPLALGGGRSGFLDNLFVTPDGALVLVEVKLWRNPEARRSVIAQSLDYAAAMFRLGYNELDTAVRKVRGVGMFELVVQQHPAVDEAEFHDAVARNLAKGRAVIAVMGDGIREEMMSLAGLLHSHAGHRFTFVLVELAVYQVSATERMIVPSVLAQTVLIERGVVQIDTHAPGGPSIKVVPVPLAVPDTSGAVTGKRRMGISEDEYFERLREANAAMVEPLQNFLVKAEAFGVRPEFKRGLNLKFLGPTGVLLNLGAIDTAGAIDTGFTADATRRRYNDALALGIGGTIGEAKDQVTRVRTREGRSPRLADLLPQHEQMWLEAMTAYIAEFNQQQDALSSDAVG